VLRFLLRPRWIAFHIGCLALIVLMANLSAWQFHRLSERRDFNERVRDRSTISAVDVDTIDLADPSTASWRRIGAVGTYLPDEQVLILNRSQNGVAGLNVVTPLLLDNGDVIAVTRGPLHRSPRAGASASSECCANRRSGDRVNRAKPRVI